MNDSSFVMSINVMSEGIYRFFSDYILNTLGILNEYLNIYVYSCFYFKKSPSMISSLTPFSVEER
jgi:hypothetical protein